MKKFIVRSKKLKICLNLKILSFIFYAGHKVILAARSEYFRAMLYGGLSESTKSEITLKINKVRL